MFQNDPFCDVGYVFQNINCILIRSKLSFQYIGFSDALIFFRGQIFDNGSNIIDAEKHSCNDQKYYKEG